MKAFARFFRKCLILLSREKFNHDLDEEMAFHRQQVSEELRAAGMSAKEAAHAARRRFGNDTRLHEQSREVISFSAESVAQDLQFALRQMQRNPSFASTAMLVLALGIGAGVAIFAFVDAVLIRPLPYASAARLVGLYESNPLGPRFHLSYPDYIDWKKMNHVFAELEGFDNDPAALQTPDGVERVDIAVVGAGFFHMLGVVPTLGRSISSSGQPSRRRPSLPRLKRASTRSTATFSS